MTKAPGAKASGIWQIFLVYLFSRFILELVGILSIFYFPNARVVFSGIQDLSYHQRQSPALEMWSRWDSEWYLLIADKGYDSYESFREAKGGIYMRQEPAKFFPAYPMTVRLVSAVVRNSVLAGILVSNVASLVFLYFFYKISSKLFDDESAFRASLFYILFPTSFFLSAVYSESFFLAAVSASFYFVEQKRLLPALLATAVLMLTRPQAIVAVPFLIWLAAVRFTEGRVKAVLAIGLVATISLSGYLFFVYQTFGSIQWIATAQNNWRGDMKYPLYAFVRFFKNPIAIHGQHNSIIDFTVAVFQLLIFFLSIRKLPPPYSFYSAAVILFPLSSTLFSFSRLCLANFPFFMYLGYRLTGRLAFMAQMAFALLLSFFTAAFANWYWVG